MSVISRIEQLEFQILFLLSKINDISKNTEGKYKQPFSVSGGIRDKSLTRPVDVKTGLGQMFGGSIPWNNIDILFPRIDTEPSLPNQNTKAYNIHSHSRYTGGALIKDVLEIVDLEWGTITNKYSPQHWDVFPEPKIMVNSQGESVPMIGQLDLVFNPDTETWGVSSYEIDVKKCYFVERDENGDVVLDSKGQEKKSPLWNSDSNKSSIVWDENSGTWRLFAVYASGD